MEPTLPLGTRIDVKKGRPWVGAIVVVHPPRRFGLKVCGPTPHSIQAGGAACDMPIPEKSVVKLVKRIVAGPDDEIYIRRGHVYRRLGGSSRFVRQGDSYIRTCGARVKCDFPTPIKVPPGYWFLMGDNRGESDDSRYWGPVPTSWIVGVVAR